MSPLRWISTKPRAAEVAREFRVCLDLNVWCAAILSHAAGRSNTATRLLTEAAVDGVCALGPTRLVVSWSMLSRLEKVLVYDLRLPPAVAHAHLARVAAAARTEPIGAGPFLVLGGSGLVPLHDDEDARVMEAAIVGRADVVVTANLAHFTNYRTEILSPDRVFLHRTADHELLIAHPAEAARWVRTGEITLG